MHYFTKRYLKKLEKRLKEIRNRDYLQKDTNATKNNTNTAVQLLTN